MRRNVDSHKNLVLPMQNPFSSEWSWLVDEAIPNWVKKTYSPDKSWKSKPFGPADVRFFMRGLMELSELFTDERPRQLPAYFSHPKFRSSYLLYFLPLQAAKFLSLFRQYPGAIDAALEHGGKTGVIRFVDLGAGPATASLAFLIELGRRILAGQETAKVVEFYLNDLQREIMADGKELLLALSQRIPGIQVSVKCEVQAWWKTTDLLPVEPSLIVLGHVLNEKITQTSPAEAILRILPKASGGGILFLEPARRRTAQGLSTLREEILENIGREVSHIWGPCLHAERCPLLQGRDWCHFSMPIQIPGKWFREFSLGLGSERQWLKFSYFWLASKHFPAAAYAKGLRRVISDPLSSPGSKSQRRSKTVLLCEPEIPKRLVLKPGKKLWRGDLTGIN